MGKEKETGHTDSLSTAYEGMIIESSARISKQNLVA